MIEINNATKKLGKTIAINDLSLNIENGIYGLVGQNGAGKSTLFRLISDVYSLDKGEILIDNQINSSKEIKSNLLFLQDDPYYPSFSTLKNICDLYQCFYKIDKDYMDSLLNKLNLPYDKSLSSFSKGMKRQAFICLALSIDVKYLLLDEAFDGIDPLALDLIKQEIIKKYTNNDKTLIIASHNLESLENLCDKFIIISNGRMVAQGDESSMSNIFIKLQIVFNLENLKLSNIPNKLYSEINELIFKSLNLDVVSFNKVGSVYEVVIKTNKNVDPKQLIKKALDPILLDEIPLSYAEIIKLQMLCAKKENSKNE